MPWPRGRIIVTIFLLGGVAAAGLWLRTKYYPPHETEIMTMTDSEAEPSMANNFKGPSMTLKFRDGSDLDKWHAKVFNDKTSYEVVKDEKRGTVLRGRSEANSSALFMDVRIPVEERPLLVWEWKVAEFPGGKENHRFGRKRDNDFAARIYVIFNGRLPLTHDLIQYVWDDHFPVGTHGHSPYAKNVKVFVVRSGLAPSVDGWAVDRRDLVADYEMLFGRRPKGQVLVIGLMTDSDNTKTSAEAFFRQFTLLMRSGQDVSPADLWEPEAVADLNLSRWEEFMQGPKDALEQVGDFVLRPFKKSAPDMTSPASVDPSN